MTRPGNTHSWRRINFEFLTQKAVRREHPHEAAHDNGGEDAEDARELPLRAPPETHGDVVGGEKTMWYSSATVRSMRSTVLSDVSGRVRMEIYDAANILGLEGPSS